MSWLYQPLPLGAPVDPATDADEALDATSTSSTASAGSCGVNHSQALSGTASTCSAGSFNVELLVYNLITSAQTTFTAANNSVRLRSRKTGGASGTAEALLNGITFGGQQQTIAPVISKLLGGTGVTCSQQSFPAKSHSILLQGTQRTFGTGFVVGNNTGTGSIPSWVQLPTQVDEQAFYDTAFAIGSGKETAWAWTSTDKHPNVNPGFADAGPTNYTTSLIDNVNRTVHGDTEGDDLWTHYNQYRRTGQNRYLNWATAWRNYFAAGDGDYVADLELGSSAEASHGWDHLYGQGLVMWGIEQGDLPAQNKALELAALVEASTLAVNPGSTAMAFGESRKWARRLLFTNYICMMQPIPRWLACQDNLINGWLASPDWIDTSTTPATLVGGWNMAGTQQYQLNAAGNLGMVQYNQGFRYNANFHQAILAEALWIAYKMTGRTDVRDRLIQMARFTLYYAWDPSHINAMSGNRWGIRPDGTHWHAHQDEFTGWVGPSGSSTGVGPPDAVWTDPTQAPTDNYEAANVNVLVYAYKLTGEVAFLKRAREHFRQATCYGAATGHQTKLDQSTVQFYADTQRNSDQVFFNYNKGMLQYCSRLFENGGDPLLETPAEWTPPYPVPSAAGQVVRIAGDATSGLASTYHSGGSVWPTNCYTDVAATEVNGSYYDTKNFTGCDTGSTFINSFSAAGAMVTAGGGGHHGGFNPGAFLFDFEDARWKRVWTHNGNPGVDNIAGVPVDGRLPGPDPADRRTGTKVHNVPHFQPLTGADLQHAYTHTTNTAICNLNPNSQCWNPTHWAPTAAELAKMPLAPDPRDQFWEISLTYSQVTPYTGSNTPHNFPYTEAEFNGLQGGRFNKQGYFTDNVRFTPTIAGTLAVTQSELPMTSHIWQNFHEMTPDEGGGTKGSIVCQRHLYGAEAGVVSMARSHRFDLETGIWHVYSTNDIGEGEGTAAGGGESWDMEGQTASAYDTVTSRAYTVGQRITKTPSRINYINGNDRTWRNLLVGSGGVVPQGRCEGLMVDPDRRLLIVCNELSSSGTAIVGPFHVIDLQTVTGAIPTTAVGGWKLVPLTNVAGVQTHNGNATFLYPWRYYPPNGNYYRIYPRTTPGGSPSSPWPAPAITVMQRLTPPPIVTGTRANFYYTTGANWVYDEITLTTDIPAPSPESSYQSIGHNTFLHYVPALQCFAWFPLDRSTTGGTQTRRSVFLIKPF